MFYFLNWTPIFDEEDVISSTYKISFCTSKTNSSYQVIIIIIFVVVEIYLYSDKITDNIVVHKYS